MLHLLTRGSAPVTISWINILITNDLYAPLSSALNPRLPFEEIISAYLIPGHIVVRLTTGVPVDKIKPVLAGNQRIEKLKVSCIFIAIDEAKQETILIMEVNFIELLTRSVLHIQIWIEGYLVWSQNFSFHSRELVGRIEEVRDYCLIGWVANLLGEPVPPLELLLDGTVVTDAMIAVTSHTLNKYVALPACIGFHISLPPSALDGEIHALSVRIDNRAELTLGWQAKPRYKIDASDINYALVWFIDTAMSKYSTTFSVFFNGKMVDTTHSTPKADINRAVRLSLPPAATFSDSGVELRAGEHAQLAFATLYCCTPTTAALRSIGRSLLRIERTLGLENGWSHRRLSELQMRQDLRRIVRPYVYVETHYPLNNTSVLVPIYNGITDTRACLESLINDIRTRISSITQIILIDDCSTEVEIGDFVHEYSKHYICRQFGVDVRVLRTHRNRGFVASVNAGLAVMVSGNDAVLLNSDAVVPVGFANRLRAAAYSRPDIASVTPLSNDATILSLPDWAGGNALGSDLISSLNGFLIGRHGEKIIDIPVGVGFCMLIKQAALADVGAFGTEWGHGYCEEVDWCLRARERGWTHVAALDTFVYHKGSMSFGNAERTKILQHNHAFLERRYPEYVDELKNYMSSDPLNVIRRETFCFLLHEAGTPCLIHFTHSMGGGTAKLVAALADNFSSVGGSNLICTRIIDRWLRGPVYEVHWHERGLTLRLPPAAIVDLVLRVETISFLGAVILVHSLTGFGPEIYAVTEATRLPYIVYVHDYQWFCPRVVLVDQSEKYCGEPGESYCQSCVRINSIFDFAEDNDLIHHDLARWVDKNAALLECAHAVVVPSNDAAKRIATHFNNIIPRCVPHPEPLDQFLITRVPDLNHQTRIAVVGGISVQKGRDVLRNLARYIDATSAPVSIEVIGSVADPAQFVGIECMRVTGSYHPNELFARLAGYHPHFVFFPGVWPETYSFVLSEVWAAGYPAVAFDIGAIAERIRATGAGVVLPFEPMPAALLLRLQDARRQTAYLAGLECRRRPAGSSSEDPVADLFRAFSRLV